LIVFETVALLPLLLIRSAFALIDALSVRLPELL